MVRRMYDSYMLVVNQSNTWNDNTAGVNIRAVQINYVSVY